MPLYSGRLCFCDGTVRSPFKGDGAPHPRAATTDGAVFQKALKEKEDKYEDIVRNELVELVVLACEVGGRRNESAVDLVRQLIKLKVRNVHPLLKRSMELAWTDRWWALLGVAVQNALTASLLAASEKERHWH